MSIMLLWKKNAGRSPYAIMAENDRRTILKGLSRILQNPGAHLGLLKKCLNLYFQNDIEEPKITAIKQAVLLKISSGFRPEEQVLTYPNHCDSTIFRAALF